MAVLAVVDDLMLLSRIRETARAAGVEARHARTLDAVRDGLGGVRLLLVDLDRPPVPLAELVSAARAAAPGPEIVGFYSHVHADRATEAAAAGVRAITRGALVRELPRLLGLP